MPPSSPFIYWRLFVAEWQEDIQAAIPDIVECLKDEDNDIRQAATKGLSRLGTYRTHYFSAFPFDVLKLVCS